MITKRYHFETIDSTNLKAKELAAAGALHGTLVTADTHSALPAGHGLELRRLDRGVALQSRLRME